MIPKSLMIQKEFQLKHGFWQSKSLRWYLHCRWSCFLSNRPDTKSLASSLPRARCGGDWFRPQRCPVNEYQSSCRALLFHLISSSTQIRNYLDILTLVGFLFKYQMKIAVIINLHRQVVTVGTYFLPIMTNSPLTWPSLHTLSQFGPNKELLDLIASLLYLR